jgi:hypothetical protein
MLARALVLVIIAAGLGSRQAAAQSPADASRPVVVELFTSEGCSSCPPADRLLTELARRPGVLALGFHVTYWNSLGWRDPWSLDAATSRQQDYAAILHAEDIYTPQLVVDGRQALVGSDAQGADGAIRRARPAQAVALTLASDPGGIAITTGAGAGEGALLLIGYDPAHITAIGRGENAGRTLAEADIVRSVTPAAAWRGTASRVLLPRPAGERLAAILQAPDGRILAVATLD